MSRRHTQGRKSGRRRGPVKRVVRGLADAFGIPRGVVIAGFVIGFVSAPLPTLLACLAALYWVDHPERVRRYADIAFDAFRRTTDRLWRAPAASQPRDAGGGPGREPPAPPRPPVDPAALTRRFERIERRARAIEEFVTSEEFRLNREFRRMERE